MKTRFCQGFCLLASIGLAVACWLAGQGAISGQEMRSGRPFSAGSGGIHPAGQMALPGPTKDLDPHLNTAAEPQPAAVVAVNPPAGEITLGRQFTVTLELSNLETPLSAFQLELCFDPTVIRFLSAAPGTFMNSAGREVICPEPARIGNGIVSFACAGTGEEDGPTGSGLLAVFAFTALAPGVSPLSFSFTQLAGPGVPPQEISAAAQDGEVAVVAAPAVALSGSQSKTGFPGEELDYSFTLTNQGNYTDSFTLQIGPHVWPSALSAGEIGPLASGAHSPFILTVSIPAGAEAGRQETVAVTATSALDGEVWQRVDATTVVQGAGVAPKSVAVTGPVTATLGQSVLFTGSITPPTATLPITYTWQATGFAPVTRLVFDVVDTVAYQWNVTGTKRITLTGANLYGQAGITHSITITGLPEAPGYQIYLPLILNSSAGRSAAALTAASPAVQAGHWIELSLAGMGLPVLALFFAARRREYRRPERRRRFISAVMLLCLVLQANPLTPLQASPLDSARYEGPEAAGEALANPAPVREAAPPAGLAPEASVSRAPLDGACYPADLDCDHDVDAGDLSLEAGRWNCNSADPCYDKVYDLYDDGIVDARDLAWVGNEYDVAPPVVELISPAEGQVVGAGDTLVQGIVADKHTVISATVNGIPAILNGTALTASVPLAGGNQLLDVVARDELGAVGVSSRVIGVDAEGPAIEIHSPKDRQAVYSLTPTLSISYTDFYTGVDASSLQVSVRGPAGVVTDVTAGLAADESGAWGSLSTPLGGDASYTLTVSVADNFGTLGSASAVFYVPEDPTSIIPPAEPEGAGWVSGVVYDSTECSEHLTNCQGLPGASVTLAYSGGLPISGSVLTGPDGFFAFPLAETGDYWLLVEKEGYTYGQRTADVVRERTAATNEIYLTPLDPAVTLCDGAGCTHTSSDGELEIEIPPGAIPDGEVVAANATNFDHVEFLPSGELPEGTWETYAYNLGGSSEVTFTQPITVRLQNHLGFAPGTPVPLGYWNPHTMQWDHAGTGIVDASGAWMVMTVTHFSNYDCNDPISDPEDLGDDEDDESDDDNDDDRDGDDDDDDDDDDEDPCGADERGCDIRLKTGVMEEEIELPPVNVLGREIAPVLIYNTNRAYPVQIIDVKLTLDLGASILVPYIGYELYIEGIKTDSLTLSNTVTSGEAGRYRYLWDGRDAQGNLMPPGVYPYAVKFSIPYRAQYCYTLGGIFGNPPDCENGPTGVFVDAAREIWVRGTVELDTQTGSSLGDGWILKGVQRLYEDEAGRILIGDGYGISEYYLPGKDLTAGESVTQAARLNAPESGRGAMVEPGISEQEMPTDGLQPGSFRSANNLVRGISTGIIQPGSEGTMGPFVEEPGRAVKAATVGGPITESTTWGVGSSPYLVTGDVTVQTGVTLTVEPGVLVKFNTGTGLYVDGALRAVGTPAHPITFTTSAATPAAGKWEGLFFNPGSDDAHNRLEYITVAYAGQQVSWQGQYRRTGIGVVDASPAIQYTTVHHSYGHGLEAHGSSLALGHVTMQENTYSGLYIYDTDLVLSDSLLTLNNYKGLYYYAYTGGLNPVLEGNTISHNGQEGIQMYAYQTPMTPTLAGNTISYNGRDGLAILPQQSVVTPTLSGNTINNNTWNALLMEYTEGGGLPLLAGNTANGNGRLNGVAFKGTLAFSTTWPAGGELPLGLASDLTVDNGVELAVEPGVEVMSYSSSRLLVRGALVAAGTTAQPITFTAYASTWGGIVFYPESDDARSILDYVTIDQAGTGGYNANLYLYEASPTIRRTTVSDSDNYGLRAFNTLTTLTDSIFEGSDLSGVYSENSTLTLAGCAMSQNGDHGLEVYASGRELTTTLTGSSLTNNTEYAIELRYDNGGGLPVLSGSTLSGNGKGDVVALRGTLAYSMTLPDGYPAPLVLEGNLTVQNGAGLVVEPGVEVLSETDAGLFLHGALQAVGTPAQPITFTAKTLPYGYWRGILFEEDSDDSQNSLEYVSVLYAGRSSSWHNSPGSGIGVYRASPTIRHTTVRNSDAYGLWAEETTLVLNQDTFAQNDSGGVFVHNSGLTVTGTDIIDNWGYAIRVRDLIDFGLPVISNTLLAGNYGFDGVIVQGRLAYSMTWPTSYPVPLAIGDDISSNPGDSLVVDGGVELTVEPGTEVLFAENAGIFVQGALRAVGTPAQPITFTSLSDEPDTGDWEGLYFEAGSDDSRSILEYVTVSYAGEWLTWWHDDYWYAGIGLFEASPTIRNTTVWRSHGYGLRAENTGLALDRDTFAENEYDGVYVINSELVMTDSAVIDNAHYAVQVEGLTAAGLPAITGSNITGNGDLNGVAVWGSLYHTMTWPIDYNLPLQVLYDLTVEQGASLTLEPGTEMLFGDDGSLIVDGILQAVGTPVQPITFTSGVTSPTLLHWSGISFEDSSDDERCLLEHVTIEHPISVNVNNASPTIRYSTIRSSAASGLVVRTEYAGDMPTVVGCSILDSADYAIYVDYGWGGAGLPVLSGNTVAGSGELDGVAVEGRISLDMTWPAEYPLPRRVVNDLEVLDGAELTIEPGAEMVFDEYGGLYVNGTLHAVGTADRPIRFIPAWTTRATVYWDGVLLDENSDLSRLGYCEIEYGGGRGSWHSRTWYANLALYKSSAEIFRCTIHHAKENGVKTYNSSPIFSNNEVRDNVRGIYATGNEVFQVLNSEIYNNSAYGLLNETGQVIYARYNWWGDASGPYHPSLNPDGLGNRVGDNVNFEFWLLEPETHRETAINRSETDESILTYDTESDVYIRIYPDGTEIHFNGQGIHEYTLDRFGNRTSYTHNLDGTIAAMAFRPAGASVDSHVWAFTYSGGQLAGITDPAGRVTAFEIDRHNHLSRVAFPGGLERSFYYDQRGLMTQQEDTNGEVTGYSYDENGGLRSVTFPPQEVMDQETGRIELAQPVHIFVPSKTAYPVLNQSQVGDPGSPAPPVPLSAELVDSADYGRGGRTGHTNKWGYWLDKTDGIGRTTVYQRDDRNNVTRVTFAGNDCMEYTYDGLNNVLSRTAMGAAQCALPRSARDPASTPTWSYTYESRYYQIKTAADPRGNTTTYIYDYEEDAGDEGNLIRIEYPPVPVGDGSGLMITPTVQTSYNAWGLVESETDQRGAVTRYVYTQGAADEASGGANPLFAPGVVPVPGLLTQVIRDYGAAPHLNQTTTYRDFDNNGNPMTVLGPGGEGRTAACSSCGGGSGVERSSGAVTHYTYDDWGRVLTEENALGIVTLYEYDGDNLVRKVQDYTADGVTGRNVVTTYSYSPHNDLLGERTVADGIAWENAVVYDRNRNPVAVSDGNGNTTHYRYDEAGQLILTTDPLSSTTIYSYTVDGALERIGLPGGAVHRIVYNAYGQPVQVIVEEGGLSLDSEYSYDLNGNLLAEMTPDGAVTCYVYDALNRLVSETRDCGGLNLVIQYGYNPAGDLARVVDQRGMVTLYDYDALGRLVSVTRDAGGLNLETTNSYDSSGNLTEVTGERGMVTTYQYDALNRVVAEHQDAAGMDLLTGTVYDRLGNQRTVTGPDGVVRLTEYNAFGLLTRVVEDYGGLNAETRYVYDNALNQTAVTGANGSTTSTSYDSRNQRSRILYADGSTVEYGYHPDGSLAWRTDQSGRRVDFVYDGARQLRTKLYPDGSTQTLDYDLAGRPTHFRQTMNGHTTSFSFEYDLLGDVISATQQVDGLSWTTTYVHDRVNGTETINYPSGSQVVESYDPLGRLIQVQQDGNLAAGYAYDDAGGETSVTHANGLVTTIQTDPLDRVIQYGSAVAGYGYGYDQAGRRLYRQSLHLDGQPADVYEYDPLSQLGRVWYGADSTDPDVITGYDMFQRYVLDSLYNRLRVETDGAREVYSPSDGVSLADDMNRYRRVGSRLLSYDDNGNLLDDGINTYTYDYEDRQVSIVGPGGAAEYVYDALGQRVERVVDGVVTYYLYDTYFRVIEERNAADELQARTFYGSGMDEPLTLERGAGTYIYHRDALGSITALTGQDGSLVERVVYDVYGAPTFFDAAGNPMDGSLAQNPILFTGRRYDPESGNYYYRARIYSPALGRFLQQDPLGYVDTMNLYAYVRNDPVDLTDPEGLNPDGWLCRNVGERLGSWGRSIFCQGPGLACRNTCQYLARLDRYDPCPDERFDLNRCLEECQDRMDRVPRPTYTPSLWWLARNGFRSIFGR